MTCRTAVMVVLVGAAACKSERAPTPSTKPAPSATTGSATGSGSAAPIVPDTPVDVAATIDLPDGPAAGLEPMKPDAVVITVGMAGLLLDGAQVVPLHVGEAEPKDLEGSARGLSIPALRKAYDKKTGHKRPPVLVVADRRVPMRTIDQVMASLHSFPDEHVVQVAVTGNDAKMALPLVHQANEHVPDDRHAVHYRPIVALAGEKLLLLSTSGGKMPQLTTTDRAELLRALEDTVKRKWPRGKRGKDDDKVLVQFDPVTPVGDVVSLAAELRAHKLFSQILLWWPGFDEPAPKLEDAPDAAAFADLLMSDDPAPVDMSRRRPGADLNQQIRDVKNAGSGSAR